MPNTIKEYLVSLGWAIKNDDWRKFEDSLKLSTQKVEKFAKQMAGDMTVAGGVAVTALAAVGGATVGLLGKVAKQDLAYQLLARRMYMSVDATKKMKIATDALGYSLEEIIWGPPELAERYRQLIKDQDNMFRYLGGDGGEKAFRQIRDIGFQFTRMEPALKVFGMRLTEDILNKLTGSPASLEQRLKQFVDWFESPQGFVHISDVVSSTIVPVLKGMGNVLQWIAGLDYSKMWASFTAGFNNLKMFMDWAKSDNKWGLLWDKDKTLNQNMNTVLGTSKDQVIGDILAAGKPSGTSALLLALAEQESGFNTSALNSRTKAFGLGQVMPQNWPAGKDPASEKDQIEVMRSIILGNLQRRKGNIKDALHDYYGWGTPGPGEPTFDQYYQQFSQRYQKYQKEFGGMNGAYEPISYNTDMGGVTIHITNPGATPEQIKKAVVEGINAHERKRSQQSFAQRQGVYA